MPLRHHVELAQAGAFLIDVFTGHRDRVAPLHILDLPVDQVAVAEALFMLTDEPKRLPSGADSLLGVASGDNFAQVVCALALALLP